MASSIFSNLSVLRARARGQQYIPASAMKNTLTDPAKLFLIIPIGQTLTAGNKLYPVLASDTPPTVPTLLEIPPIQSPQGLVTQRGNANATPGWIDGFAAVPMNTPKDTTSAADISAILTYRQNLLAFGRIAWKGDEQIFRTMYLGDMQRVEMAYVAGATDSATPQLSGQVGLTQAACGAPGGPVYRTPGYVWTGRSSAEWYLEYIGPDIVGSARFSEAVMAIYVYGQFMLNIDPLSPGTADTVQGGSYGPGAGVCDDGGVQHLDATAQRQAAVVAAAAGKVPDKRTRNFGGGSGCGR